MREKKYYLSLNPPRSADGVGGYVMYPHRVCVDPQEMKHTIPMKSAQLCSVNI